MGAKGRKDNFAASVYRIMPQGRAPSTRGENLNWKIWSAKTDK
jgi:hypothetical protein